MKNTLISTVYDNPEEEESTVLRTAPPTVLKHKKTTLHTTQLKQMFNSWKEGH